MVRGVRAIVDEPVVFLGSNLLLAAAVVAVASLLTFTPAALVLAPLLALPASAVLRLASVALADGVPTPRTAWAEARRRAGAKLLVAGVQLLVTILGIVNVLAAAGMGGLVGALSTIAVGYALLAVWGVATALWPLLSNPARDAALGRQLRLAVAVVLARPLDVLLLLALAVGSVIVSVQLFFPALLLPSFVLLTVTAYVEGVLQRLDPLPAPPSGETLGTDWVDDSSADSRERP